MTAKEILTVLTRIAKTDEPISADVASSIQRNAILLKEADTKDVLLALRDILVSPRIDELMFSFPEVFITLFPDLEKTFKYDQHTRWHAYDLYTHISHVVANVKPDFVTRFAALLHDNGKPRSVSVEYLESGGYVYHFPGHPAVSAEMADPAIKRYGVSQIEASEILFLIARHDNMIAPTKKSVGKIIKRIREAGLPDPLATLTRLLDIQTADHADHTMLVPIPSEEILAIARELLQSN